MPIQSVSAGPPTTLTQNVVYALPAGLVQIATSSACQVSVDGAAWTAYTSDTQTAASFIRSAGVNTVVTVKSATKGGSTGGGGSLPADAAFTSSVATGAIPALTGQVRLSNAPTGINVRNSGNTTDLNMMRMNGSGMEIGVAGTDMGFASQGNYFSGTLTLNGISYYLGFIKRTGTPTPIPNQALVWGRDNGSGKMQLMVQFPTGAPVQIAIEP